MTDKFKELLEMEKSATPGKWEGKFNGASWYDITREGYGYGFARVKILQHMADNALHDASLIAASRNSIRPLIELLLTAETALQDIMDRNEIQHWFNTDKQRDALAAIDNFRRGA